MLTTQLQIFFPDEITVDILSRLHAKKVLRCRLVCRRWRDLTSTPDFELLHRSRSTPVILVAHPAIFRSSVVEHFLLDRWWEPERKRLVFHRFVVESASREQYYNFDGYWVRFSHGGLIVFQLTSTPNFLILNPASGENVRINLSKDLGGTQMYGVFFHPLLREYCSLWHYTGQGCYKLLNLGPNPCWREISNPWSHRRVIIVGNCNVLVGEYLYWMVEHEDFGNNGRFDVLVFDIRREKFGLLHCPVPSDVDCVFAEFNLLDIDGVLSFVLISNNAKLVNMTVWKLKDVAQQEWIPMNHTIWVEEFWGYESPIPIAIVGEELSLMFDRRVYVFNLKLGNTRTFVRKKYNNPVGTFSHVMSLASLRNCKSKISMNKVGLIDKESNGIVPDDLSITKWSSRAYSLA